MIQTFIIIVLAVALGVIGTAYFISRLKKSAQTSITTHSIAERVRSVGKLIGLEVLSKEIVTQTKGLGWLPPILLSQARLAMIFSFEKQYYIDLGKLRAQDVVHQGGSHYAITLPPIEGQLTLQEVTPYDIQSGKLMGLLDVLRMDATTQKELMDKARVEASSLYEVHAARYEDEARRAITRQITGLLDLFDVDIEVRYADQPLKFLNSKGKNTNTVSSQNLSTNTRIGASA